VRLTLGFGRTAQGQGRQSGHEIHRADGRPIEGHLGCTVPVRCLEGVDHFAGGTERQARNGDSGASDGKQEMEAAITIRAEIRKDSPDLSVAELNQLISQTSLLPTFSAVDLAYKNLISGGTLSDLPSPDLKKELAEFYAAHEVSKLIQNTQELQYVTIWQPYALNNLDYAASNRKIRAGRDHPVLRPYIDPDLILTAMKTKQFENVVVIQWETAEDLVSDWSGLLERVKRIQAMLPSSN
jgi:hypothetical protein